MFHSWHRSTHTSVVILSLLLFLAEARGFAQTNAAPPIVTITNLQQLTSELVAEHRVIRNVRLEVTVLAASSPSAGVVIAQDETEVELLEVGNFGREIIPGERLFIRGLYCLLRKREIGIELAMAPMLDDDGVHVPRTWPGNWKGAVASWKIGDCRLTIAKTRHDAAPASCRPSLTSGVGGWKPAFRQTTRH